MSMSPKRLPADSFPGPLNESRAASTAAGTALSTTPAFVTLLDGTQHVVLRAYAAGGAANVMQFALNPYMAVLVTTNSLGAVTDYSSISQQNPADATGAKFGALDTYANGSAIYIGTSIPIRGVRVTMSASVNAVASVMTASFWNGTVWAATAFFSDGTANGGATLAQTGNIVWADATHAMPAFTKARLHETQGPGGFPIAVDVPSWFQQANQGGTGASTVGDSIPKQGLASGGSGVQGGIPVTPMQAQTFFNQQKSKYWVQLTVSAKLSATVNATLLQSMSRAATSGAPGYAEAPIGDYTNFRTAKPNEDFPAHIEALTDTSTAKVIVNCHAEPSGLFSK